MDASTDGSLWAFRLDVVAYLGFVSAVMEKRAFQMGAAAQIHVGMCWRSQYLVVLDGACGPVYGKCTEVSQPRRVPGWT